MGRASGMDDDKQAPIRDYEIERKPDDPKTDTEIQEDDHHDELEGDDGAA